MRIQPCFHIAVTLGYIQVSIIIHIQNTVVASYPSYMTLHASYPGYLNLHGKGVWLSCIQSSAFGIIHT